MDLYEAIWRALLDKPEKENEAFKKWIKDFPEITIDDVDNELSGRNIHLKQRIEKGAE
jgi:hypothetical protein